MTNIFEKALNQMSDPDGRWRDPESFQGYALRAGLKKPNTAGYISVQSLKGLAPELVKKDMMVFRLGSSSGSRHTNFALAKAVNGWNDYFLFDIELFGHEIIENKPVQWDSDKLVPFSVIAKLTETSYVNLALSTGIFEDFLGLSTTGTSIPATGKSSHSFEVRPHTDLPVTWIHESGQVEVDSIFLAKRNGKKILCIVEAKAGNYPGSLPKYKLAYPIFTIADYVPEDIEIVPIYLHVNEMNGGIRFFLTECSFPDPRYSKPYINELVAVNSKVIEINL